MQDQPETQDQASFQLRDNNTLVDYPEMIRQPQSTSEAELDEIFQQAGYKTKPEAAREEATAKLSKELEVETPTGKAEKEFGGPKEAAKVVGGAVAGFANIVANGVHTAADFLSNFGQQSKDFKNLGEVIPEPMPDTPAGKALKQIGIYVAPLAASTVVPGGVATAAVVGAAIDFVGIDTNQDNLSNLVQEVPWMRNSITAAAMHKPGDSQLKSRSVNAFEGLLTMGLATGLFKAGKAFYNGVLAKKVATTLTDAVQADKAIKNVLMGTTDGKVHITEVDLAAGEAKLGANAPAEYVPGTAKTLYDKVGNPVELDNAQLSTALTKMNYTVDDFKASMQRLKVEVSPEDLPTVDSAFVKLEKGGTLSDIESDTLWKYLKSDMDSKDSTLISKFITQAVPHGGENPTQLFHGTSNDFTWFNSEAKGAHGQQAGTFFTDNHGVALGYAQSSAEHQGKKLSDAKVIPVTVYGKTIDLTDLSKLPANEAEELGKLAGKGTNSITFGMVESDPRIGKWMAANGYGKAKIIDSNISPKKPTAPEKIEGQEEFGFLDETKQLPPEATSHQGAMDYSYYVPDTKSIANNSKQITEQTDMIAQLTKPAAFTVNADLALKAKSVKDLSKAIGINLESFNTTDDVLQVITDIATQNKEVVDQFRRLMSHEEAMDAGKILLQSDDAITELIKSGLTKKQAHETLAAKIIAHKMLTTATAEEMVKRVNAAVLSPNSENLSAFMDARDKFKMVFLSMRGTQSEIAVAQSAGRAIIEHGVGLADRVKFFDEALRMGGGHKEVMNQIKQIKLISEMPSAQFTVRGGEIFKASRWLRMSNALSFYTLNNILTLKSLGNATVGNAFNLIHKDISLFTGAGIGTFRRVALGAEQTLTFTDAYREVHGQMLALKEAFAHAATSVRTGRSTTPGGVIARIDLPFAPTNPLTTEALFGIDSSKSMLAKLWNIGANIEGVPVRLITPADSFFGTISYRGRQNANALRRADELEQAAIKKIGGVPAREQLDVIRADKDSFTHDYMKNVIDQDAVEHAEQITFSGENSLSSYVNAKIPIAKVVFPVLKTNVNEMKFIFENSPFMLLTSKAKSAYGREADMIYGGVATAMAGIGALTYLAHTGVVTGSVPKNPALEKKLYETNKGWKPDSLNLFGTYIPLEKLGLFGAQLRLASFINDARNYVNDGEYQELFTAGAAAILDAHTPESYIANVGDFFKALAAAADPAVGEQSNTEKVALDFVRRMQPLGGVQNQIARAIYPAIPSTVTDTTGSGNMMAFIEKATTILKSRTPYLSRSVPPQVNLFGEVMYVPSGWSEMTDGIPGFSAVGEVADMVFPFAASLEDNTPIVKELKELAGFATEMGKSDLNMPTLDFQIPSHKIRNIIDGQPFQLTSVEYYKYMVRSAGKDPETGKTISPNGLTLRQTMEGILSEMGKKQIDEIYREKNGPFAVKIIMGKLQKAFNGYRQQGIDYLGNDTDVYDRMQADFENRNKAKILEGGGQ